MARKKCAALLFGAAGLLPSQAGISPTQLQPDVLNYTAPLEILWNQLCHRLEIKAMAKHEWHFFRLRPQNFPTRRLAALTEFLYRYHKQGFLEIFSKPFAGSTNKPDLIVRKLEMLFSLKPDQFWSTHYTFTTGNEKSVSVKIGLLLGKDRVREIIINIILPILHLYSRETDDGVLMNAITEIYRAYPRSSDNKVVRTMLTQLGLHTGSAQKVFRGSAEQQGLIQLHKKYCRSLRCDACLSLSADS